MSDTKYGRLFLEEPWGKPIQANPDPNAPIYINIGQTGPVEGWDQTLSQVVRPIYQPLLMIPEGHVHNCDEILYFIGGDPMNFREFGAEVEFYIGEEREKHIVNSTTWVYIPKGLIHCPLNFKRVDKPIIFGHFMLAPTYESTTTGSDLSYLNPIS